MWRICLFGFFFFFFWERHCEEMRYYKGEMPEPFFFSILTIVSEDRFKSFRIHSGCTQIYNILCFSITKFTLFLMSLFSHLCQLKVTQSFQYEIQSLLSNSSVLHDSPLTSSLPSHWVSVGLKSKREGWERGTTTFTDCPSEPASSLWLSPFSSQVYTHDLLTQWRAPGHRPSLALRDPGSGTGPWAFLMDPHTALQNSGRLCPKRFTDMQLLYHTGHMV